jgi:ribosome-associated protein
VSLEAIEIAKRIVEAAADKQASDVVLLDTRRVCSFADYFVICSGETEPQIKAIRQAIEEVLEAEAIVPHHYEGSASSGWTLLDLGEVIVHIFAPFEREYYQLEKLWEKASLVVKMM